MAFDDMILEPIANGYNKLPEPIKNGTSNFTSNIAVLLSIPNSLLQGNISQVGHSTGSFIVNSTVGILGIFNPAEKLGLKVIPPKAANVGIGSLLSRSAKTAFKHTRASTVINEVFRGKKFTKQLVKNPSKAFKGLAKKGRTSTGWFFGFKLHFIFNTLGEIVSMSITGGNVNDRSPVMDMVKVITGKLIGDKNDVDAS